MVVPKGRSVRLPWDHVFGDPAHPRYDRWNAIYNDPKQNCCSCETRDFECSSREIRKMARYDWPENGWKAPLKFGRCPDFDDRFELVAFIGGGSYGAVYAAKAKQGDLSRRYAVKFESRESSVRDERVFDDHDRQRRRYTDALIHAMLEPSGVVAPVVGVYIHGALICVVMELFGGVDKALPELISLDLHIETSLELPYLRSCTGDKFGHTTTRPRVQMKQIEACRVFWCLLGGFSGMVDAGISHNDFAARNYLVDNEFRGKIIDFSLAMLHPSENDFNVNRPESLESPWTYHTTEYICWKRNHSAHTPEYLNWRLTPRDENNRPIWDMRRSDLWAYGTCLYEVLHGAMPWRHTHLQKYSQSSFLAISKAPSHISDLGPIETADKILEWKKARRHQGLRNEKIVNEPLPVREDLDQDLVDVIHALFIKDPSLRCDVRDLVTFPWFQGWQEDAGYRFYNHMTPFGEDSPDDPGYNDRQARRKSLANRLGASHDYSDPVEDEIEDVIEYQEVSDDDPYMEDKLPPGGGAKL